MRLKEFRQYIQSISKFLIIFVEVKMCFGNLEQAL